MPGVTRIWHGFKILIAYSRLCEVIFFGHETNPFLFGANAWGYLCSQKCHLWLKKKKEKKEKSQLKQQDCQQVKQHPSRSQWMPGELCRDGLWTQDRELSVRCEGRARWAGSPCPAERSAGPRHLRRYWPWGQVAFSGGPGLCLRFRFETGGTGVTPLAFWELHKFLLSFPKVLLSFVSGFSHILSVTSPTAADFSKLEQVKAS